MVNKIQDGISISFLGVLLFYISVKDTKKHILIKVNCIIRIPSRYDFVYSHEGRKNTDVL